MEQPAALCGFSLWLAPLGFPRGEAAEQSEADEGWRELESSKIPVEWYKTETNAIYPAAFMNQPVAAPHQSQRKHRFRSAAVLLRQLPPGGSQEEVAGACAIQCTPLFREWQVAKSPYHLQIAYSCNRHNRQRFPIDKILVPSYNENSVMKHCFMYRKELAPCLPSRNLPVMKLPPLPIR